MGQAIALLAPIAFGVALSPVPVAEFLLILLSRRARTNGLVFLVTSLVLLTVVPLVAALTLEVSTDTASSAPSTARSWIFVVLGLILLLLAARKFRQRDKAKVPAVFDKIAGMGPGAVLLLVPGATVLNPKNLALLLSAGSQLGAQDLTGVRLVITAFVFALLGASPYVVAVAYLLVRGDRATVVLERAKAWVLRHNATIMSVLLGALGLFLVSQGAGSLLA